MRVAWRVLKDALPPMDMSKRQVKSDWERERERNKTVMAL
jgi:hypothetical protein